MTVGFKVSLEFFPLFLEVVGQSIIHIIEQRKYRRIFVLVASMKCFRDLFTS